MKSIVSVPSRAVLRLGLLIFSVFLSVVPLVHAGVTFTVDLYVSDGSYVFYTPLNTNAIGPAAPLGIYNIYSPGMPTNGSWRQITYDNNGWNTTGGFENNYTNLSSALQQITNGTWTLGFTNTTTTNVSFFTVSLPGGLASNQLPVTFITSPANGANNLTNQPTFTWTDQPTNWPVGGSVFVQQYGDNGSFYDPANQPNPVTNWTVPVPIPASNPGNYTFFNVSYVTNYVGNLFVATTPTNNSAQPIGGWAFNSILETGGQISFTVAPPPSSSNGHKLVAHYTFDNSGNLGQDASGNTNDFECESLWNAEVPQQFTNDAIAGGGAVQFFGDTSLIPCSVGSYQFNAWTNTLLGSFTVSAWIKTTTVVGNDGDQLHDYDGQTVVYVNNNFNGVIPLGITGHKAAIATGLPQGASGQDTLNSSAAITTGSYVHVVVTRDAGSGLKQIYVNGVLDSSDYGEPGILDGGPNYVSIGGEAQAPYTGKLDDLQIYSGVLDSSDVAYVYNHPGSPAPTSQNTAGLIAHYDFDEGTAVAADVSGNGNNLVLGGTFGGFPPATNSTAKAGPSSVSFDGLDFLTAPASLLPTLAASFSISLWVNTTQNYGSQGDYAYNGAGIISADIPGLASDVLPVALTGGEVAFNTGDTNNGDDTINSSATVNDGNWHHIVVCRNQGTGEKDIYVDGNLDTSDFSTTNLLNAPQLLTIGTVADASNPNPNSPSTTGYGGYLGLVDDIQIYSRQLDTNEVTYLYENPGLTLTAAPKYSVDVNLQMYLLRTFDPNQGEYYSGQVSFNSVTPAPTTTNSVQSPNNQISYYTSPTGGATSSAEFNSLSNLLSEVTNGLWSIYINQGTVTQQVYTFQASISGLDTNVLPGIKIFSPTNGSVNVATNSVFYWNGPTNYSTLVVDVLSGPTIFPPVTTTNWPSPPILGYGPNRFDVNYTSNNFSGAVLTTPVDDSSNAINGWVATVDLGTLSFNNFVVGAAGPAAVLLTNVFHAGANVDFSFRTLAGRTNTIQSRTNLVTGTWRTLTNFIGDGSLRQFAFPATNPPLQFFRVETQ